MSAPVGWRTDGSIGPPYFGACCCGQDRPRPLPQVGVAYRYDTHTTDYSSNRYRFLPVRPMQGKCKPTAVSS
jgi:hypothetical protein